nr:MAG TPA: hypothetical protein [Caudoviricetes sp.]
MLYNKLSSYCIISRFLFIIFWIGYSSICKGIKTFILFPIIY